MSFRSVNYRGGSLNQTAQSFISNAIGIPAGRPYAFWIPVAFVFIAGFVLSIRNYLNHTAADAEQVASVETNQQDMPMLTAYESAVDVSQQLETQPQSRVTRLCISMAIVAFGSLIAGFSFAHLLSQSQTGFATIEEAQASLPIPVLGAVPIRRP
jgi:hypothetical protein